MTGDEKKTKSEFSLPRTILFRDACSKRFSKNGDTRCGRTRRSGSSAPSGEPEAPRLAVLDWMMPGLEGVQVCQRIRQDTTRPYMYLLLLTARSQKDDLGAAWSPAPTTIRPSPSTHRNCERACTSGSES